MPSGLHLVSAHSITALAEQLAAQIVQRPEPFKPETVLVMSYAQRIWLQRFLTEKIGICANIDFKSPEEFLSEIMTSESKSFFALEPLTWRIFDALKKMDTQGSAIPQSFLFGLRGKKEEDFFLRASELAALFWRYQSFRPQMICDWKQNAAEPSTADEDFLQEYRRQKNLWEKLKLDKITVPAEAWIHFLKNGFAGTRPPERIFAFAPSALPRVHAELLEKLAEKSDVFLYYHNLASGLWTESSEEKTRLRERLRQRKKAGTPDENTFFDDDFFGNELLAAWGKAAKPLAKYLIDHEFLDETTTIDEPPAPDTLLHALQHEISTDARTPAEHKFPPDDRSLRISVAPTPLREMEILRDELLARFSKNADLKPRDILVELTNIETYAPFIRAAFENSGIPFTIADRSGTEIFPAAAAFLEMLRIAQSEFRFDEIIALLDNETTRQILELSEDETASLRTTLAEAGVRWGHDADFRHEKIFGESQITENFKATTAQLSKNNSWKFGLRRLALGYFFGNAEADFSLDENACEPSAIGGLTEDAPQTIGKIFKLVEALAHLNQFVAKNPELRVTEWCEFLRKNFTDTLFENGDGSAEILRRVLGKISDAAKRGALSDSVPACSFQTFFAALERQDWSLRNGGNGLFRGKLTFCEMRPMRNIPAKIICIAGLSDGAFPRSSNPRSIDLTHFDPKNFPAGTALWDRTQRDDACLLFLESILAAQDALLLSYVGRSPNDGQELPPCVPLAKLRDFLLLVSPEKNSKTGLPLFETKHRLYGFSSEYFSRSKEFFSFSKTAFETAKNILKTKTELNQIGRPKLSLPVIPTKISSTALALFFYSPADFLLKYCFEIAEKKEGDALNSDDPAETLGEDDYLEKNQIHNEIFEKIIASKELGYAGNGVSVEEEFSLARAHELAAGKINALDIDQAFEKDLNKKFRDFEIAKTTIPSGLKRIESSEIPEEIIALPQGSAAHEIVVVPTLRNLFRTADGKILNIIFGQGKNDWRAVAKSIVAAAVISEIFPNDDFSVLFFAYEDAKAREISKKSFENSKISLRELAEIYASRVATPPLFFKDLPFAKKDELFADFSTEVRDEWNSNKRRKDAAVELFIFGENPTEFMKKDMENFVFNFVNRAAGALNELGEKSTGGKKPQKKKSSA